MDSVEFFRMVDVRSIDTLMKYWSFIKEGLGSLNKISASSSVDVNILFKVCVDIVCADSKLGKVAIVLDKNNGEPLSYTISFENTCSYSTCRSLMVYAIYSNRKSRTATRWGLNWVADWAKKEGYKEMHGESPRVTGAAVRLFENIFGFRKHSLFLKRSL